MYPCGVISIKKFVCDDDNKTNIVAGSKVKQVFQHTLRSGHNVQRFNLLYSTSTTFLKYMDAVVAAILNRYTKSLKGRSQLNQC